MKILDTDFNKIKKFVNALELVENVEQLNFNKIYNEFKGIIERTEIINKKEN